MIGKRDHCRLERFVEKMRRESEVTRVREGRGPGEDGHQCRVTGAKWSPPPPADTGSEC